MFKLLLFDLDGTLIDSLDDITSAVNFALSSFSDRTYTSEEVRQYVGSGFKMLLKQAAPEGDNHEEIQKKFLSYYRQNLTVHTRPFHGVVDTLKELNGRKKAVVTNKNEAFSRDILKNLQLDRFFEIVIGGDSTPYKKPSPVPINEVLHTLNVSPDESLMIGDGEHDIEAAHRAGVKSVAVTYGYRDKEELKQADYLIDNFQQLIPLLSALEKA